MSRYTNKKVILELSSDRDILGPTGIVLSTVGDLLIVQSLTKNDWQGMPVVRSIREENVTLSESLEEPVKEKQLDLFEDWHATLESEPYENEQGGRQTKLHVRSDLLPPYALLQVSKVLSRGEVNYGKNNWVKITAQDHLNHAMTHVLKVLCIDQNLTFSPEEEKAQLQDQLMIEAGQATTRMLFYLDSLVREQGVTTKAKA